MSLLNTICVVVFFFFSVLYSCMLILKICFFCQAEDGIRDLVRSRGLGDVYKRQFMKGLSLLLVLFFSISNLANAFELTPAAEVSILTLSLIHI